MLAKDKTGPAVRSAADGLDKLGRKTDEAERQFRQLEREAGQLSRKMLETKAAAALLGREFAKTGDEKTFRQFQKLSREADKLGKVLHAIKPPKIELPKVVSRDDGGSIFRALFGNLVDQAQKAGKLAGESAIGGFGDAFGAIPAEVKLGVIGALAGAAVLAAPLMAAAIEGAVLTGVAGGGIAAGLILAAQDPRVQTAYANLGNSILTDLQSAARPFADELLAVAPELADAFAHELPRVRALLASLAGTITPLTRGAIGFADNLMPGLTRAAAAGKAIVTGLAQQLPALGAAVGHLLSAMAEAGPAAKQALTSITDEVIVLIHTLALGAEAAAPLLNGLAKFDSLVNPISGLNREGKETVKWVEPAGVAAAATAQDYALLAQSLGNTANRADALNASFSRLFGEAMNLDQANLAVKQGMLALRDATKENGATLDQNTAKGQANAAVVLQQIQTLDQKRQAEIAAGNGTEAATAKANGAYAGNLSQLRGLLTTLGYTKSEVDALIGKYEELAKPRSTTFTTRYRSEGNAPGAGNSRQAGLSALNDWMPARFAEGQRAGMQTEGASRTGGPVQIHSEFTTYVDLDGKPFRAMVARTVSASEKRQAWRAKVGKR